MLLGFEAARGAAVTGERLDRVVQGPLHRGMELLVLELLVSPVGALNDGAGPVDKGVVCLSGFVESTAQRNALRVLAEETNGVTGIDDQLRVGMPNMSWT